MYKLHTHTAMIAHMYAMYTIVPLPTHTPSSTYTHHVHTHTYTHTHTHTHTHTQEGYWFRKVLQEEPFEHCEAQKYSNYGCEHISALREPQYGGMHISVLQSPHKIKPGGLGEVQQLCCGGKY